MKNKVFICKPYTFATDEIEYILSFADELKKGAQCFSKIENHGDFSTIWIRKELKK